MKDFVTEVTQLQTEEKPSSYCINTRQQLFEKSTKFEIVALIHGFLTWGVWIPKRSVKVM